MWFLFMIVGLYIIIPFVKCIVKDENLLKYFLCLSLIFTFIIPQILSISNIVSEKLSSFARSVFNFMGFYFTSGYTYYFILGYFLNYKTISKKKRIIIYVLSLLGFIFTIISTILVSNHYNALSEIFYGNLTINVMLEALGVFVLFKNMKLENKISKNKLNYVYKISRDCLGIYLIHPIIINLLELIGINTLSFNPIFSVIIISLIVWVISLTISDILNRIPIFNKYFI